MNSEIPRRNNLSLCQPAELAIYTAVEQVEKLCASVKLTDAIMKLNEARELVADFIDQSEKDWRDIKTYEDAVEFRPVDEDDVIYPTDRPHIVDYKKVCHIVKAINGNWRADYNNEDQRKWFPVFLSSGSGFVFSDSNYRYDGRSSAVGSRLVLENEEKSDHLGKTFLQLFNNF